MSTKLIAVFTILMSMWLVQAALHGQQEGALDEVNRAIADAHSQDVQPYSLRHPIDNAGVTTGLVYTPYVRIARFARRAILNGHPPTHSDVPAAVSEPVIHVVMVVPREDPRATGQPVLVAEIRRSPYAPQPDQSAFFDVRNIRPAIRIETRRAAEAVLGVVPLNGVSIVGVFPLSALEHELVEFCSYQNFISETGVPGHNVVAGYIRGPLR